MALAPEHVIENLSNERKAAADPNKMKKLVKKKPPEKGYIPWNRDTFEKLRLAQPEQLKSQFQVSHAMILHVLSRGASAPRAMRQLVRNCHETPRAKRQLIRRGFQLFRSLVDRNIVQLQPTIKVNIDLQQDFSLDQALSLYLIDSIEILDPNSSSNGVDLLTLVESILDDPEVILRRQLDKIKTRKMAEMKAQGMEFDERIEELEKLEYPKPNQEWIYESFNAFAKAHPWIGQENISPKSIAREMFEQFFTFQEYIKEYGLERCEGLLLRYLSDAYHVLTQTVPIQFQKDHVQEIIAFLYSTLKGVDSSLIDEWEQLKYPDSKVNLVESDDTVTEVSAIKTSLDVFSKEFSLWIRNEVFKAVRNLSQKNLDAFFTDLSPLASPESNVRIDLEKALETYFQEHTRIKTDPEARSANYYRLLKSDEHVWIVEQIVVDSEGNNDWSIRFEWLPEESKKERQPILRYIGFGPLSEI